MVRFAEDSSCIKCGNTGSNKVRYCVSCAIDSEHDHMHRICGRCGYEWIESPVTAVSVIEPVSLGKEKE